MFVPPSNNSRFFSGGTNITLENVASIAATGVDRISVGALTHSAVNLDFGLDF